MRSRSLADALPPAFGAVAEGVWTGAMAALVTGDSGAAYMAGAATAVAAAALLARYAGRGEGPGRGARALAVALTLVVAATMLVAEHSWSSPHLVASVLVAVAFSALLVLLGISLGRETMSAERALRRALRGFGLLCVLLALAALSDATPGWASGAVVAALVAGALLVVAARAEALSASVPAEDRAPAGRWLLAVVGVLLFVVAVGALVSLLLQVDVLLWALAAAGDVIRYLLQLVAFVVGWVGAGLVRVLSWALGLFHLRPLPPVEPPAAPPVHAAVPKRAPGTGAWGAARVAAMIAAAAVAVAVPLLLVAFALRRFRRPTPTGVEEERESVLTFRAAAGQTAGRLRRRLAGLVPHRRPPASPAELVRRRYEELERRLAHAGHPRPPGRTVRAFLQSVSGAAGGWAPAAELASAYERARYSAHALDSAAAQRFESLAAAFAAAVPAGTE